MVAKIFKPPKTSMQSGIAQTKNWVLEMEHDLAKTIDPLMGWTGSADTIGQVQLRFNSQAKAEAFAKEKGIPFIIETEKDRKHIIRDNGYGENFTFTKKIPWTH